MCDPLAVVVHHELRHAHDLFHFHIRGTFHRADERSHFIAALEQLVQIVPVDLHGDIALHACDQFVEAHLDRLLEAEVHARDHAHLLVHPFGHHFAVLGGGPLVLALHHDDQVLAFDGHGVGGDLARPDLAHDLCHFREFLQQDLGEFIAHMDALGEVAALTDSDVGGEVALVQFGNELATKPVEDEDRCHEQHQCAADHQCATAQERSELWRVPLLQAVDHAFTPTFLRRYVAVEEERRCPGYVGEAEQQRTDDGEADGERHRAEHLALDTDQGENGHVHDEDDDLTEHGALHDAACALDGFIVHVRLGKSLACEALVQGEHEPLHHDHSPVHDQAEVERAHAHEVGALARDHHATDGEEQRERDHAGHDQSSAPIAQHQDQHADHDQRAEQEVLFHRADRLAHELGAVHEGVHMHAFGQAALHIFHARFHGVHRGQCVRAAQHQHHAAHGLAFAVARHGTIAHSMTEPYFGHIADAYRASAACAHDDVLHVLQRGHDAFTPDEVDVRPFLDVATARIAVVVLQRCEHIDEREPRTCKPPRIHAHLVLLEQAAEAAHVDHALNAQQLLAHDPILYGAQFEQVVLVFVRAIHRQRVLVDLAGARGGWGEFRPPIAGRYGVLHLCDALADELPRDVHRHLVLEHHGNHAEAAAAYAAQFHHVRQVLEGLFQRERDELLHLLRGEVGRYGVHQHLIVGHVWQRVDGQLRDGIGTPAHEGQEQQAGDELVADGECNDAVDHAECGNGMRT